MRTDTINKPFVTELPTPTAAQLEAAARFKQQAADCYRREEESFQRSDTDGFLSQWASNLTARKYEAKAKIMEQAGYSATGALFEGDRVVKAKVIESRFGVCWMLADDEAAKFGRKFIPCASYRNNSKVQKQLGLHEGTVYQPAWVKVGGSGTGLSGCASAHIEIFPTSEPFQTFSDK